MVETSLIASNEQNAKPAARLSCIGENSQTSLIGEIVEEANCTMHDVL